MSSRGLSRQDWLRSRPVVGDPVDPRPVEDAVLEQRADTMRDMVRSHVAQMAAEADERERGPDDFAEDWELGEEAESHVSNHQLTDLAERLMLEQDPVPDAEPPTPPEAPSDASDSPEGETSGAVAP